MIVVTDPPYNAVGDGVTDDTLALQAAIDAGIDGPGHVYIPAGRYVVTTPLVLSRPSALVSLHLQGACLPASAQWGGTAFVWKGGPGTSLLRLVGVVDALFEDFAILANAANPLGVGIQCENAPSLNSQRNTFRNLFVSGTANTDLDKGFRFTPGAGTNGNNDDMLFDKVRVYHTNTAAFSFEHTQSLAHNFQSCHVSYGARAVTNTLGPSGTGGSFTWTGGLITSMSVADFDLGSPPGGVISIDGVYSEGSKRFLQTGGSTNAMPVTLRDCRWASDALHADGNMIVYGERGPLTITGCMLGSGALIPYILLKPNGTQYVILEGNHFKALNSVSVDPVRFANWGAQASRVWRRGNTYEKPVTGGADFRGGD